MKRILIAAIPFLFLVVLSSCKKTEGIQNQGIVGNWLLTEVYDGYANGGSFKWNNVSLEDSHTLTFTPDGKFTRQENETGNFQKCSGTYEFLYSKVVVSTFCEILPDTLTISELKPTSLIIDRQGIEGTIRYKYKATK